ncbi:trypsin-like [Coccinella septempunctata]|uniref:trypsin-like n=1 Tax=Coccinella septempunctata TaxID=41139 RepID=UPI001D067AE7|nr:trypsin-like [Coccinella septempunctata]
MILDELRNRTTVVDIKNHPYIVSIQKEMIHSCCGTIISSSWIMTTSRCLTQPGSDVQLVDTTKIAVVAGQSQLGLGKMQLRRAKNLFLHNRFVKKMLLNDIGMINLYEPFELNDYVNVVLLASSISKPYKFFSSCYVISWTVYRKDFLSFDKLRAEDEKTKKLFKVPELQQIDLPTITYEECCDRIEAKDFITRNQICTEYGTLKNISCPADAGSPLICGERQYGIFSWGIGCEDDDYPGVFTKVSSFRKWINNIEMDPNVYIFRNKGVLGIRLKHSIIILVEMFIFIMK